MRPGSQRVSHAKVAREILRRLPPGYTIAAGLADGGHNSPDRRVGKHDYLFGPDGEVVRGPEGRPITVAGTPRSHENAIRATLRDARRAGIRVAE